MDVIRHGQLFGPVSCFMYTIEWQKRGLPHAHILLWLQSKLMSTDVESVISAELPNPQGDPVLFHIIKTNMIHGPCGQLNRNSPCMDNGRCTKRFPRKLLHETKICNDGYPLYSRRAPQDGGHTATYQKFMANISALTTDGLCRITRCFVKCFQPTSMLNCAIL